MTTIYRKTFDMVICPECGMFYSKKGIGTHLWRKHGKGKTHDSNIGFKNGTREIWNKGKTKKTDVRVENYSQTHRDKIRSGELPPPFLGKHHSNSSKERISKKLSENNHGGRCKWFEYVKTDETIFRLQGTWEVRFAKILDKIDPSWIKLGVGNAQHSFEWVDSTGRKHFYTPDFYSPKTNKYYEVKGHWWGEDKEKMNQICTQNQKV